VVDLSRARQQQLAHCQSLLGGGKGGPKLLLLDEPTESIQPSIHSKTLSFVQRIMKETGISVLLVENNIFTSFSSKLLLRLQLGGIVVKWPTEISLMSDPRVLTV